MTRRSDILKSDNLFIGADKSLDFTIDNHATPPVIVPITGWALEWVLRLDPESAVILTKTVGSGITITDGPGGKCRVTITDDDTVNLLPATYYYTLRRSDSGAEDPLAVGSVVLQLAATR